MNQPIECPHCHNPIYDDEALLCHFCGESLSRPSRGALGKIRYQWQGMLWVVVALILLSFVFLMVF